MQRRSISKILRLSHAGRIAGLALTLLLVARIASAHAVLIQSSPAANATVQGPDVPITLKYNSRVDGSRSTLRLVTPHGQSKPLTIEQSAPETINAVATGLNPGSYAISWQVLATDGHITRGRIPFVVK